MEIEQWELEKRKQHRMFLPFYPPVSVTSATLDYKRCKIFHVQQLIHGDDSLDAQGARQLEDVVILGGLTV